MARSQKKTDKNPLNILQSVNDLHDAKCIFGDENPPFWLFDCGGYVCNQCSFRIVAENVKNKHKCPKCEKDLKNFRFINRYVSGAATPQEGNNNNTVIDLDDVNVSGVCLSEEIEMQNVYVEEVNTSKYKKEKEKEMQKDFEGKEKIENQNNNNNNNKENDNIEHDEHEILDCNNIKENKKELKDENENNNNKSCLSGRKFKKNKNLNNNVNIKNDNENNFKKETCQICFVLKSTKRIQCESATPHMICSYCYNRMLKIDKVKVCPFCRTKIIKI